MTLPAEEPGTPLEPPGNRWPREMVALDRIRLTGLLRKKPWKRGFFYAPDSPATRQARPAAGLTAVSVEPLGAVARRCPEAVPATSRSAGRTLALAASRTLAFADG